MEQQKVIAFLAFGAIFVLGALFDAWSRRDEARNNRNHLIKARKNLFLLMISQIIRTLTTLGKWEEHKVVLEEVYVQLEIIANYKSEECKYEGYREIYRQLESIVRETFFHNGGFKSLEALTAEAQAMEPPELYNLLSDMGHLAREGLTR